MVSRLLRQLVCVVPAACVLVRATGRARAADASALEGVGLKAMLEQLGYMAEAAGGMSPARYKVVLRKEDWALSILGLRR
jgi:hypothetical protein